MCVHTCIACQAWNRRVYIHLLCLLFSVLHNSKRHFLKWKSAATAALFAKKRNRRTEVNGGAAVHLDHWRRSSVLLLRLNFYIKWTEVKEAWRSESERKWQWDHRTDRRGTGWDFRPIAAQKQAALNRSWVPPVLLSNPAWQMPIL